MIYAELHGKGPEGISGSEDVLTSSVFGLLELLPPNELLLPWLQRAERIDGQRLALDASRLTGAEAAYWPSLPLDARETVEPDLLLSLDGKGGSTLLMLEAKYRSGPSGWPSSPDADEIKGQLGRQWLALQRLLPSDAPGHPPAITRRVLVYVTADFVFPRMVLLTMASEVTKVGLSPDEFQANLYWLGWRELSALIAIRPSIGAVGQQLQRLLAFRKLDVFIGCSVPSTGAPAWSYTAMPLAAPETVNQRYDLVPPSDVGLPVWRYADKARRGVPAVSYDLHAPIAGDIGWIYMRRM